jgi:hypothetical protein
MIPWGYGNAVPQGIFPLFTELGISVGICYNQKVWRGSSGMSVTP